MIVLDAVTVPDKFPNENAQQPAAIMFPAVKSAGGYFNIQNNPVYVELAYNIAAGGYGHGQSRWTRAIPFPVGPGIILPGTVGIRFQNYTPGAPALVSGALAEEAEPSITVTSSGNASSVSVLTIVATLPSPATDGQEVLYKVPAGAGVPADGAYWHVKYIASITKWVVLGGTELRVMPTGSFTATGAAYATVAGTPTIAIPNIGSYLVEWGFQTSPGNATDIRASLSGAGVSASDNYTAFGGQQGGGTTGNEQSPANAMEVSCSIGTLGWQVRSGPQPNNGTGTLPWMKVMPQFIQ